MGFQLNQIACLENNAVFLMNVPPTHTHKSQSFFILRQASAYEF